MATDRHAADRPATVLVVDDNAPTRYTTSHVLRGAGLIVVEAATGREAIDRAMEGPDLVVLDINLPDIDGFEVCRELRARPETRHLPVIYLSATFVDDVDKVHGVNAGADGYLTHPVEPPVLIATVRAFLRAHRAEAAVQTSEAKFTAIFENALNGIALLSDDLILIDVNPAMCALLGRDREALVGRHLSAFSVKDHALDGHALAAALHTAGAWRGVAPVLNAIGGQVDLEWNVSRHSLPGINLAVVNDITARRVIEAERERLLASERAARTEAEQASRLKDDFLAALSHELRTPLNAIMGFSRLLQLRPIGDDPEAQRSIAAIERNARVQAQLISDLLDLSRIAAGKLELDRQWFNPVEAIGSALASSQNTAAARRVTIAVDTDGALDDIWWDPTRFQQVVWNLVDNAVKFSMEGGSVEVQLRQNGADIELEVRDAGAGIAAEFLPHVFDRFRQEDSSSRRWHGGLGLGLTVVHQIVSAHGATIEVHSAGKGQGSSFVVRMPGLAGRARPAGSTAAAAPLPAGADLRDLRVLVVDDNADARALIRGVLEEASAQVLDVATADAAVEALSTFAPDVLVSDVAMPHQDGYDLIRRVRAAGWSAQRLPAIALTAFARDEDRRRALAAGFQSHCAKPPEPAAFLADVRALANGRR